MNSALRSLLISIGFNVNQTPLQNLDRLVGSVSNKMMGLAKIPIGAAIAGAGAAGVASIVAVKSSLDKALDFESQLSSIKALTGATVEEMLSMEDLALEMGSKTKYSALEAAKGIEELLKAGLTPAAVKAGGLEAALNLATAGGLGLSEASEIMATSLNSFKKDGMSAADVSNILAGTANAAAASVHGLGYSLSSVGSVADMIGMSFKDVNTAIGIMTNDGNKDGESSGTSLKAMLMYLQPQTDKAVEMFNQLGIGVGKANKFFKDGKIKDLAGVADVLQETFNKMNDQDRTAAFLDMFGTDGVKAATSLYKAGSKGVKQFYDDMGNVTALEVATERMNNGKGAIEQFKGALETLQIRGMKPFLPAIKSLFTQAGAFIEQKSPQIIAATQAIADKAKNYLKTHFIDNQEFRDLSVEGKINFVFNDVIELFNSWYASSGSKQIEDISKKLAAGLASGIEASAGPITDAAMKIGASIAKGMDEGLQKAAADYPVISMLLGGVAGARFGVPGLIGGVVAGSGYSLYSSYEQNKDKGNPLVDFDKKDRGLGYVNDFYKNKQEKQQQQQTPAPIIYGPPAPEPIYGPFLDGSHANGLSNVPFDGYLAELHKGERVLTASDNQEYSSSLLRRDTQQGSNTSSGGLSPTIYVTIQGNATKQDAYDGTMAALDAWGRSRQRRNPQVVIG
ncbi:phage tail tape measure protein [Paenibacillus periandrae]|uniref:phage tail tape measure protein n=1 Tax=Paenibacillus periandrae TaxID=1761741 RepID=UPI001F0930E2|nr:phage tail tape measure protein [Paenibacillus periandrae]